MVRFGVLLLFSCFCALFASTADDRQVCSTTNFPTSFKSFRCQGVQTQPTRVHGVLFDGGLLCKVCSITHMLCTSHGHGTPDGSSRFVLQSGGLRRPRRDLEQRSWCLPLSRLKRTTTNAPGQPCGESRRSTAHCRG